MYHYAGNNPVCYTDPTGEDDVWMACEWIVMLGGDFRLGTLGYTGMLGNAYVTFTNLSTKKSFSQCYDIKCYDSFGLNTFAGISGGFTMYFKSFPDNASEDTVSRSYTGIFASFINPFLYKAMSTLSNKIDICGVSVSSTMVVGVDPEKGFAVDKMPWIGVNFSLNFNIIDLFLPDGISIPSAGVQYSVYKKTNEEWSSYDSFFEAAKLFSKQPLSLIPMEQLVNQLNDLNAK